MPSDSISERDWTVVADFAVEFVNALLDEDSKLADESRKKLVDYLDCLDLKYGPMPSILATRADYCEDRQESVQLLHRAWELAKSTKDKENSTLIASSLAVIYIEEQRNFREGAVWLANLSEALKEHWDEGEENTRIRLLSMLG